MHEEFPTSRPLGKCPMEAILKSMSLEDAAACMEALGIDPEEMKAAHSNLSQEENNKVQESLKRLESQKPTHETKAVNKESDNQKAETNIKRSVLVQAEKAGSKGPTKAEQQSIKDERLATEAHNEKPQAAAPDRMKTAVVERPLSQVELAMRHMKELEERQISARALEAGQTSVKKEVPAAAAERAVIEKPVIEIAEREPTSSAIERNSADFISEKPVELPVAAMDLTAPQVQKGEEIGTGMLQETPEHTLHEEEVPSLELPMVVEPEDGQEPDYEALFQEMVAEFAMPALEGEVVAEPGPVWTEGLFELDSMDELVVEVRERAETHALELPEVVPEMAELGGDTLQAEEAMPLPAILEMASAANEVLAEAAPQTEETYDEVSGEPQATASPAEQAETAWQFAAKPELDVTAAADETNELDYHNPESLFAIMRELMWSPATSDFAANNGSVGHRLGRMLVQLITGRIDTSPALAIA